MTNLYYKAPDQECFDNMKSAATKVWSAMDNTYGYVDEKTARVKDIANVGDNFMYMLAMFDQDNQAKVVALLTPETQEAVRERLLDYGNDASYLTRIGL